jgi:hypothetical protein
VKFGFRRIRSIVQRNKLKPKKEVKTARVPMIPEADFPMLFRRKH